MQLPPDAALAFLPVAAAVGLYVAWSDLKYMKIPNKAVLGLGASFVLIGLLVLPFEVYIWRLVQLFVVLVIGFLLNMVRMIGAGDAKYAAAMAPFVAAPDAGRFLMLFCVALLVAFILHRSLRRISPLRAALPDWASWTNKKFPMGLALGPALAVYLAIAAFG